MSFSHDDFMQAQLRIADLEAENARLQEERDNLRRLNTQIHEVNENHVLERDGYKALAERRGEALTGLMKDMHTGRSVSRGSFGRDGLGCGRPCSTCDRARAALAATPNETKE